MYRWLRQISVSILVMAVGLVAVLAGGVARAQTTIYVTPTGSGSASMVSVSSSRSVAATTKESGCPATAASLNS